MLLFMHGSTYLAFKRDPWYIFLFAKCTAPLPVCMMLYDVLELKWLYLVDACICRLHPGINIFNQRFPLQQKLFEWLNSHSITFAGGGRVPPPPLQGSIVMQPAVTAQLQRKRGTNIITPSLWPRKLEATRILTLWIRLCFWSAALETRGKIWGLI